MHDVIIIGGSFAGLAAATQLGRARRRALVLDTGLPRNRFASHSYGFLTRDGATPDEILGEARRQLRAYTSVELRKGLAVGARHVEGGFQVVLENEERLPTRKLILAHGVADDLSILPEMEPCWGKTVFFCPYCHGFEFADRRLGLLLRHGDALELSQFYREWTKQLTLFTNGAPVDAIVRGTLEEMGVAINDDTVLNLAHEEGQLQAVVTASGPVPLDALFTHPPTRFTSHIGVDLGCETKESALGQFYAVDHQQETSIAGVFAAGDIARPAPSVSYAVADGVAAGVFAHRALLG